VSAAARRRIERTGAEEPEFNRKRVTRKATRKGGSLKSAVVRIAVRIPMREPKIGLK
jgi:hypothetical protein